MAKSSVFNKFWFWALVLLAVIIGLIIYSNKRDTQVQVPQESTETALETDNVKGNQDSNVVLVEYADFQCPACATYFPIMKSIEEEYGDRIKIIYRHFPLVSLHPNAIPAAVASEAAAEQNAFWKMHDILFTKQNEWSDLENPEDKFVEYADEIGLNVDQFREDLSKQEIKDRVTTSLAEGNAKGINATPTFYLNGTKLQSPRSLEEFRSLIETALNSQ